MIKDKVIGFFRKFAEALINPTLQSEINEGALEVIATQRLNNLVKTYLPWSRASLSHVGMLIILNDIFINQRETILEFGSGISTVYIAKFLQQHGKGHLFSVEQDKQWMEIVSDIIQKEGAEQYVTFIHAPLLRNSHALTPEGQWHDESILLSQIPSSVDMLIVDGPADYPDAPDPLIRYPSLPIILPYLSSNCSVFLDDTVRRGERKIIALWEQEFMMSFRRSGKISFAFRGEHYKPFI